jgi:hypothetical protein
MAQVLEYLPTKYDSLSSSSSTTIKKERKEKRKNFFRAGGMFQGVECLLWKHKALSSNCQFHQRKKKLGALNNFNKSGFIDFYSKKIYV